MLFTPKAILRLPFKNVFTIKRHSHTEVRVRFAPSPTGYLHLGGLRTALYNYLFARSQKGKFLLRIEDTDQTRLIPGATQRLIDDLLWTGIEIDEGPGFGGQYGPYIQSERTEIYNKAVRELLANGTAYHCFCTERRLDLVRKEALRLRQVPRYDNKCRNLTPQEVEVQLAKRQPSCIRLALSEHTEPLNDLIYGSVQHNVSDTEGDPVIMKSDSFPTYHFANVVDDHLMGVTHVLRGVEWQISTTKHLLLYKAFGWEPPKFGHLPLLVNADGSKLSKRQGDIGVQHFREKGYFPAALVNYVISAGGGFSREKLQKPQIFTIAELVEQFNIEKVNSHPSRLCADLLNDFNRLEIIKLLENEQTAKELVERVQSLVKAAYVAENLDLSDAHVRNVLQWAANRLTFIQDLTTAQLSFLWVKPTNFQLQQITAGQMENLLKLLTESEFSKTCLHKTLKAFADQEQIKFPLLMKLLRSALSGLKEGPGVAEMMEILGKTVVLERLEDTLRPLLLKETIKF